MVNPDEAPDADRLARVAHDRDQRLVVVVVDLGEVGQRAVCEAIDRREEASIAGLGGEVREALGEPFLVAGLDRADLEFGAVAQRCRARSGTRLRALRSPATAPSLTRSRSGCGEISRLEMRWLRAGHARGASLRPRRPYDWLAVDAEAQDRQIAPAARAAIDEVKGFLQAHPPFDALDAGGSSASQRRGDRVPRSGTTIFPQGDHPVSHLRVIRRGAVEIVLDGRVLDLLGRASCSAMPRCCRGSRPGSRRGPRRTRSATGSRPASPGTCSPRPQGCGSSPARCSNARQGPERRGRHERAPGPANRPVRKSAARRADDLRAGDDDPRSGAPDERARRQRDRRQTRRDVRDPHRPRPARARRRRRAFPTTSPSRRR